jgi:hypothetical protein
MKLFYFKFDKEVNIFVLLFLNDFYHFSSLASKTLKQMKNNEMQKWLMKTIKIEIN